MWTHQHIRGAAPCGPCWSPLLYYMVFTGYGGEKLLRAWDILPQRTTEGHGGRGGGWHKGPDSMSLFLCSLPTDMHVIYQTGALVWKSSLLVIWSAPVMKSLTWLSFFIHVHLLENWANIGRRYDFFLVNYALQSFMQFVRVSVFVERPPKNRSHLCHRRLWTG